MSYTPTVWVDGSAPDIDAANLNHLENGLQAAAAVADAALPTPAGSNGQFLQRVSGVWVPHTLAVADLPTGIPYSNLSLGASVQQSDMAAGNKITAQAMASGPPSSPSTGDIWIATAVDSAGTAWMFRYDSTQTTYKWVFCGGIGMYAIVTTFESTSVSSPTFTDLATVGPSITIARAGDYQIEYGFQAGGNSGANAQAAVIGNGSGLGLPLAITQAANAGGGIFTASMIAKATGLSASEVVKLEYNTTNGVSTNFQNRYLRITPIRVI